MQKLKISIDNREEPSGIMRRFEEAGIEYKNGNLPIGDFLFGNLVAIEKKGVSVKYNDLEKSLFSRHLYSQLTKQNRAYRYSFLWIVGDLKLVMAIKGFKKIIESIMIDFNTHVLFSTSEEDFFNDLQDLHKRYCKGERVVIEKRKMSGISKKEIRINYYMGLPQVAQKTATILEDSFKAPINFIRWLDNPITKIEGFGKKKIANLRDLYYGDIE